jgi:hypothetical protein
MEPTQAELGTVQYHRSKADKREARADRQSTPTWARVPCATPDEAHISEELLEALATP